MSGIGWGRGTGFLVRVEFDCNCCTEAGVPRRGLTGDVASGFVFCLEKPVECLCRLLCHSTINTEDKTKQKIRKTERTLARSPTKPAGLTPLTSK